MTNDLRPPIIMVADGQYYNAVDPNPGLFTLENIAISTGNTCRWGGHIGKPAAVGLSVTHYSVAEHQVLGAQYYLHNDDYVRAKLFMMHDALEPYIGGDIPTPQKVHMPAPIEWEKIGQERLLEAFDLEGDFSLIKDADKRICRNESICLFDDRQEWLHNIEPLCFETGFDRTMIRLKRWTAEQAANEWYQMAHKLELKNKYV